MLRGLALAALLASPAVAQVDHGGRIGDYVNRPQAVISGRCESACTLNLRTACLMPDAMLFFHEASLGGQFSPEGTEYLARSYKPRLAAMYRQRIYGLGGAFWLSADQLVAMGYRRC